MGSAAGLNTLQGSEAAAVLPVRFMIPSGV